MALSISLSHGEGEHFTPGSMVLGVVQLTNHEDQIIESLMIDFRGLSSVFLNQNYSDMGSLSSDAMSKAYLFSRHLELYSGEGLHHKGTHVWPFAFRIPLFAAPRLVPPGSKEAFYPKYPWRGDFVLEPHRAHPLPPSIEQNGRFVCTVRYSLDAALSYRLSAATKPKKLQASRSISVQKLELSPRTSPGGGWVYGNHRHTLCSSIADSWYQYLRRPLLVLRRKDKHLDSDTKLCFSVLLPKEIEMKEQQTLSIPVACTMIHLAEGDGVHPTAMERNLDLVVHSFKFSLFQHTHVRAGCHNSSSMRKILTRKGTCIVPVSHKSSLQSGEAENSLDAIVNLGNIVDLSIPRNGLAADFSTYNIARFHSLELRFSLSYGGKKNKFALRNVPIRVVPQFGGELECRLRAGLEADDEYGCDLAGIQWRDYRVNAGSSEYDALGFAAGGDDDIYPEIPPPRYTA